MNFRSFLLYLLIAGLLIPLSCTNKQIIKSPSDDNIIIYPSPPDPPRIQFLTSINTSFDIAGKQSGFNKFIFGEEQPKPIIKPYGIFVRNGKLYIADTGARGIVIIDPVNQNFDYFIPSGLGQLQLPINCFVDEEGKLYIADGNRRQIVIFDEQGKYVNAFGDKENFKPTDVFVQNNKIFVANLEAQKIQVYDSGDFSHLYNFPETDQKDSTYLYQPVNIYVAHDRVYVSDFGDFKIKIFTPEGKFLESVGRYGRNFGEFVRPKGIAVDRDSNLYVVDAAFENTQIFNSKGELLMFFGGSYNGEGSMGLPAGIAITEELLDYFRPMVHESFELIHLIFVTNQYGSEKINVYGYIKPR